MLQAAIFDFDGLLLATEVPEFTSWLEIYASHGQVLDQALWSAGIGTRDAFDPYALLAELTGRTLDRGAIQGVRRPRNEELILALPLMAGVEARLSEARALGLKLAVASSGDDAWVYGHLERLDALDYFDAIVCAGENLPAKPHPAVYVAALERLGASADEAIAFEDSPNGIAGAKAAGVYCIAVPNTLTAALDLSQADRLILTLEEVSLAEIASSWPAQSKELRQADLHPRNSGPL